MDIDEVQAAVAPLLAAKGASRAVLFGSVARGTDDGRSDVDLIVVDDSDLPYFARLDKYYDEMVETLRRPLDLFVYREAEFEKMRERSFLRRALAEGKVIRLEAFRRARARSRRRAAPLARHRARAARARPERPPAARVSRQGAGPQG